MKLVTAAPLDAAECCSRMQWMLPRCYHYPSQNSDQVNRTSYTTKPPAKTLVTTWGEPTVSSGIWKWKRELYSKTNSEDIPLNCLCCFFIEFFLTIHFNCQIKLLYLFITFGCLFVALAFLIVKCSIFHLQCRSQWWNGSSQNYTNRMNLLIPSCRCLMEKHTLIKRD